MSSLKKVFLLGVVVWLCPLASWAASEGTGVAATVRLEISPEESRVERSWWQDLLGGYLGVRGQIIQRPAPGTGFTVYATAYAPSLYQTDARPCITAAGTRVRPGTVAANFLPLGTLIQIGNEVYIVEDRMNPRYWNNIDIFFPLTSQALEFGKQELDIVVLGYGKPGQTLPREEERDKDQSVAGQELVVDESPPSFRERWLGKLNYWQQVVGDLLGVRSYDVNRYDVDCFGKGEEKKEQG